MFKKIYIYKYINRVYIVNISKLCRIDLLKMLIKKKRLYIKNRIIKISNKELCVTNININTIIRFNNFIKIE